MDGKTTTDPAGLAEMQMEYYCKKNLKLQEQVEENQEDPLATLKVAMNKWDSIGKDERNLELKEITLMETATIINGMGDSKARGHDEIEALVIKLAATTLLKPINYLVNLSLRTMIFPTHWKIGKVLPLYKGKGQDKQHPSSYRPVSLLPTLGKIAERAVQQQIVKYMDRTNQWHENMHAYRKEHSTCTALLQLSDEIFQAAEMREIATAIMIDESSAFDCINFDTLDGKMKLYGFGWRMRTWIMDYLTNRSQYTEISGKKSSMRSLKRGVPQGSVIGPTIFSLYINEMPELAKNKTECEDTSHKGTDSLFTPNCSRCGQIVCFADDATYVSRNSDRNENQKNITRNMKNMKDYLNANDLAVNETKTAVIEVMNKQKRSRVKGAPPIIEAKDENSEDVTLAARDDVRLLGVNLSKDLTWATHLETGTEKNLLPALRKQLGILKYIAPENSSYSRKIIAQSTIISRILYAIPVWGGITTKYCKKLQTILNNTARVVTGLGRRTSTMVLMRKLDWLTIKEMVELQTLVMVWKVVRWRKPAYLAERMKLTEDNTIRTEVTRLHSTSENFRHRGTRTWNTLDTSTRECTSLGTFRKYARKEIIDRRLMML